MQFIQDRPFAGGSRDARTSGSSVGGPDTLAGLAEVQRGARTLPDVMSVPGQTEKNSVRAYVFRFALKLGHRSAHSGCLKGAKPETSRVVPSGRECATHLSVERYGLPAVGIGFSEATLQFRTIIRERGYSR